MILCIIIGRYITSFFNYISGNISSEVLCRRSRIFATIWIAQMSCLGGEKSVGEGRMEGDFIIEWVSFKTKNKNLFVKKVFLPPLCNWEFLFFYIYFCTQPVLVAGITSVGIFFAGETFPTLAGCGVWGFWGTCWFCGFQGVFSAHAPLSSS